MLKLEPNKYYHIYNRGNNKEKLFYSEANYEYFLNRFRYHCFHVLDTYAFCLLGNHFHLLVSVRSEEKQQQLFEASELNSDKLRSPSRHLGNFFNSYTQSINKEKGRVGSLFQRPFKRKEIDSEEYFRKLVVYIHQNSAHHGFTDNFSDYSFSSYPAFLNDEESDFINKQKVLELFGGIENFKASHDEMIVGKEFLSD